MTNSSVEMLALAERVEAATGPDRELDHDIAGTLEANGPANIPMPTPRYTASLDAAMTLIPDEWTAWQLRSRRRKTRFVATLARLIDDIEEEYDEQEIVAHAATPALALTAAALRAHAGAAR